MSNNPAKIASPAFFVIAAAVASVFFPMFEWSKQTTYDGFTGTATIDFSIKEIKFDLDFALPFNLHTFQKTDTMTYPDNHFCDDQAPFVHVAVSGLGVCVVASLICLLTSCCELRLIQAIVFFVGALGAGAAVGVAVLLSKMEPCVNSGSEVDQVAFAAFNTFFGAASWKPGFFLEVACLVFSLSGVGSACTLFCRPNDNERNNTHVQVVIVRENAQENAVNYHTPSNISLQTQEETPYTAMGY